MSDFVEISHCGRVPLILLASLLLALPIYALPTNVGYSGAPGRGSCAASCHGIAGGTVQVFGMPASYVPNEQYLITVKKMSGVSIKNFNASCRLATGTQNAGLISAGLFTGTYNVFGETNGVHMTTLDHDSAQFTWTAPAPGFGVVRLYVAAHQGERNTGPNTNVTVVSMEAPIPPGQASGPNPGDGTISVPPDAALQWTEGVGATSHDLYFGTTNPPPLLVAFMEGVFFDPDPDMSPGATYYWRVDAGVTEGNIWSFTIMNAPGQASNPIPADFAVDVLTTLIVEWQPGIEASSHDVYFGTVADPPFLINVPSPAHDLTDLLPGTIYFWRVDEVNAVGTTPGVVWQFTTLDAPDAATNPSPADDATEVIPAVVLDWTGDPTATSFDVLLDIQNPPLQLAGTTTSSSLDPPGLLQPNTVYYWQVITYNPVGETNSEVWSFSTEGSVADDAASIPSHYELGPMYPNPFNAEVTISFALPASGDISLKAFDVVGREVALLTSGHFAAGRHSVLWNSSGLSSGVYLIHLTHATGVLTAKVVALK